MRHTKGEAYYEFNPLSAVSPNGQFTIKIGKVGLPIGMLPVPLGGVNGKEKQEANAKFIAEAFNVAHETNKSPRQLADENKELLEALVKIRNSIKNQNLEVRFGPTFTRVEQAINKSTS